MQIRTLEPLKWQTDPTRVTISLDNDSPKVCLQVTGPKDVEAMCLGRPVEELPRILTLLGPAHHLASAKALDDIFQVEPPEPATNMRDALLYSLYFYRQLRKVYFLLSLWEPPFMDFHLAQRQRGPAPFSPKLTSDVMHHVALGQEAAAILGGRSEHPLKAIAGGVSQYLKDEALARLQEIVPSCLEFSKQLAEQLHELLFEKTQHTGVFHDITCDPLAFLTLDQNQKPGEKSAIGLYSPEGKLAEQFNAEQVLSKIDTHEESWTYTPFAFIKDQGWPGLDSSDRRGIYFVGPLARLNAGNSLETPEAEAYRQRLTESLGAFPRFDVAASLGAMVVDIIFAAEKMNELSTLEKCFGPSFRTVPTEMGQVGHAALESPEGLIYHHYQVDSDGMVLQIQVLDTTTANNAIRCLMAQKAVETFETKNYSSEDAQNRIAVSLLAF